MAHHAPHMTMKNHHSDDAKFVTEYAESKGDKQFRELLESGAQEAYARPWHRIERGLRLNRLRIFIEEIAPQYGFTKEDKEEMFTFFQKALDKKLLNTLKVVHYDTAKQRILSIKGLEIQKMPDGRWKASFHIKAKPDATRKKKKEVIPMVSTQPAKKMEETDTETKEA